MDKKKQFKAQQAKRKNPQALAKAANSERWKYIGALALILIASFVVYLPVLHNDLLSWDDESYITTNKIVQSFNMNDIFSEYVKGNYHPITMLTFAIEYRLFGLNETGYHMVNLLIHLLNVILVYYAVLLLSGKQGVALVASLLFGIHPIHVESVAWVAELKDLLYTFFFLASYIYYLRFLNNPQKKFYVFAIILFLLSLLSKAMAASLPVVLLLTDYFKGRKINTKVIIEKIPFFALAIIFGVIAMMAQKTAGATDVIYFSFPERIAFACYGFFSYLFKLIFPMQLSAYYPYPMANGVYIVGPYYTFIFLFLILAAIVFYSLRFSKKVFFSIGFFAATVFLVLQLFPVGGALMADRYSYIPSIGIFYLAGEGFMLLWNRKLKPVAISLLTIFSIFFLVKTNAQCAVWNNNLVFWNDVIRQNQTITPAYYNRGLALMAEKRNDEALKDFNKAIELKPDYVDAYNNRGIAYLNENKYEESIKDFNTAISLKPELELIYINRGKAFMYTNKLDDALNDYNKAIALKPDFIEAFYNRGTLLMKVNKNDEALKDFDKTIELNSKFTDAYVNRGIIYYNNKNYNDAVSNYTKAIELQNDYANAYYLRGLAEFYQGKKEAACTDLKTSSGFGYQLATDAMNQICR